MVRSTRYAAAAVLCAAIGLWCGRADAASAVFSGDPIDPSSGQPYEIQPGRPLVKPGADGRLGTADDVVDGSIVGDIDLVVRLGSVLDDGTIPSPSAMRKATATGVAGARGVGTAIPFHVYLSDGAGGPAHPYGNLLAAPDMNGLPVVVLLFADFDGDGRIGPADARSAREVRQLRELEPVGREVALLNGGVASGTIAVTAGAPENAGGVTVVAAALAFTGTYDPGFLGGLVPAGPAIMTALPFVPERDLSRVFSQDIGPLSVTGTLNPSPRAAGIPDRRALDLALPTGGSSPSTDTARVMAGPAVCARVVEQVRRGEPVHPEPEELVLPSQGRLGRTLLQLVAVDRLGNPTDVAAPLDVRVAAEGPFVIRPNRDRFLASESFRLRSSRGTPLLVGARGAGAGALNVLVNGALCQRIPIVARSERTLVVADARVSPAGDGDFLTIGDAVASAVDRTGDGRIVIAVDPGLYRESVRVNRAVEIYGAGTDRTVIDARGTGPALALANAGAVAVDLTASGGTVGVSIEAPLAVATLGAHDNIGAGIRIASAGAAARDCEARQNGEGFAVEAAADVDGCRSERNFAAGIAVRASTASVRDSASFANFGDGIDVQGGADPTLTGNTSSGNIGAGVTLEDTSAGLVAGNRAAANDGNGLRLNKADGALVDGNDFSANGGFGMRIGRSSVDFDAAAGVQPDPPGNNDVSGNRRGELRLD
jgi:parallel beta-helix repeat protein